MARRTRGRAVACAILPRGVHAAGTDRRHRLPEQDRDLRSFVQDGGRGHAYDRAEPQVWSTALTHHTHVHMIVPGGGISLDSQRWIACPPTFFLPVPLLSRLFRRLFLK